MWRHGAKGWAPCQNRWYSPLQKGMISRRKSTCWDCLKACQILADACKPWLLISGLVTSRQMVGHKHKFISKRSVPCLMTLQQSENLSLQGGAVGERPSSSQRKGLWWQHQADAEGHWIILLETAEFDVFLGCYKCMAWEFQMLVNTVTSPMIAFIVGRSKSGNYEAHPRKDVLDLCGRCYTCMVLAPMSPWRKSRSKLFSRRLAEFRHDPA